MAPIKHSYGHHSTGSGTVAGLSAGIILAILALMTVVFICVFIHENNKGKSFQQTPQLHTTANLPPPQLLPPPTFNSQTMLTPLQPNVALPPKAFR
jgi:hypothetical protein